MPAESILRSNYREQMDDLGLTRPDSVEGFEYLLYETAAMRWTEEFPPDRPPEYLFHVDQVDSVAANIVGTSILADDPEVLFRTHELAYTHDLGRAVHMGKYHPVVGARMLEHMQADDAAIDFAVDHHRMGLGLPQLGEYSRAQAAIDYQEGRSNVDPVLIFHETYGLAGCAVLIADSSKAYTDPDNPNMSRIAPFSEELFEELMQRQFRLNEENPAKGYAPGSARHRTEIAGRDMILRMIDFLRDQYGIDYIRAIEQSQQDVPTRDAHVHDMWQEITEQEYAMAA